MRLEEKPMFLQKSHALKSKELNEFLAVKEAKKGGTPRNEGTSDDVCENKGRKK